MKQVPMLSSWPADKQLSGGQSPREESMGAVDFLLLICVKKIKTELKCFFTRRNNIIYSSRKFNSFKYWWDWR